LNIKKKKGHVDYDTNTAWLTEKGWQFAQEEYGDKASTPLDTSSVHTTLIEMHKLTGAKLKIFHLLKESNEGETAEFLMDQISISNKKSFGTYISALKTADIVESVTESDGTKKYQLVEETCFPLGRM
jgi:hypothetical protein